MYSKIKTFKKIKIQEDKICISFTIICYIPRVHIVSNELLKLEATWETAYSKLVIFKWNYV